MRNIPLIPPCLKLTKTASWKIACLVLLFGPCLLRAEEKPRVEVWFVNTRCAPPCGDWEQGKQQIGYWRLGENRHWLAAESGSLLGGGEKNTPTVFLIHGNRVTNDEAVQFAWPVYCWLCKLDGRQSFRVVIWSWPSSRTHRRHRADVQTKAAYSDAQSYYLADCLRGMKSEAAVSLIGYSFGARIITGGLHLLGGGTLGGRCLPTGSAAENDKRPARPIRAVLVAAAMDCFALAPGQSNANAPALVEEMLVTRNECDRALRFYSRLYGRGGPQALGFVGPCCGGVENIRRLDVTCAVGKTHEWENYLYCSGLFNYLPKYVFAGEK